MKWNKCKDVMPPLYEEVLILYKDKADELKQDNLFYGLSMRCKDTNFGYEKWSSYIEYPGYYEVIAWMPLPNMPIVEEKKVDWYDISADEMTLEQARQAVKDLRKICLSSIVESEDRGMKVKDMTREEATEKLNRCREILEITSHMDNQNRKAFDMAVKALEQEPCGKDINVPATDAISRQAAIDALGECPMVWMDSDAEVTSERDWKDTVEMLKSLPSVIPQPKTEVLDKIRAEIEAIEAGISSYHDDRPWIFKDEALAVIDKYKAESEDEE